MRKLNMILVLGIFLTFLVHAVMGAFKLMGADVAVPSFIARILLVLVCGHVIVTGILTAKTLIARKRSGAGYFRNNLMFWARRLSGLAIIIPLVMHIVVFSGTGNAEQYRLIYFDVGKLISQILFAASLGLHVLININPLLMGLGVRQHKAFSADFCFVLLVILITASVAFFVYYCRWISI